MKNTLKIFLILVAILSVSCNKNDEGYVIAGKYDGSFLYFEFKPALKFNFEKDEQTLIETAEDSVDMDFDSKYDLYFKIRKIDKNNESYWYTSQYCVLKLINGYKAALCKEYYAAGHANEIQQHVIFVDTINYGEKISDRMDWNSGSPSNEIILWSGIENAEYSNGSWYYTKSVKYIGVKSESGKLGWIELNAIDPFNIKIVSYALQK